MMNAIGVCSSCGSTGNCDTCCGSGECQECEGVRDSFPARYDRRLRGVLRPRSLPGLRGRRSLSGLSRIITKGENMPLIELEQGTQEWLDWRKGLATASDAAVIMGVAPEYLETQTWNDLRLKKIGLAEEASDYLKAAAERGSALEDEARAMLYPKYLPVCAETEDNVFGASLDGYSAPDRKWLEIKCPVYGRKSKQYELAWVTAGEGEHPKKRVLPHVWWQLVHQAAVIADGVDKKDFGLWVCDLIIYVDPDVYEIVTIPLETLLEDAPVLMKEWGRYFTGEDRGPNEHEREDEDWSTAAAEYRAAKLDEINAKLRIEKAKDDLLALADHDDAEGCGVKVKYSEVTGSVDWQKLAKKVYKGEEAISDFAEGFRKKNHVSAKITVTPTD